MSMLRRHLQPEASAPASVNLPQFAWASSGTGHFDLDNGPKQSPNFLYALLAPAWAEANQMVIINQNMAASLHAALLDDRRFVENSDEYEFLSRRTSNAPHRRRRLSKLIMEAINGLPRDISPSPMLEIIRQVTGELHNVYPTTELVELIYRHAYGWGPLEPFMNDQTVTEIMVDGYDRIFTERTIPGRRAHMAQEMTAFESPRVYDAFINSMIHSLGVSLDQTRPTVDFSLPTGARVNVVIPPITAEPVITIRRPSDEMYTLDRLQNFGSFDEVMRDFIHEANLAGANVMTYGETGSGKTTLLSALLHDKPSHVRIVVVEDTREIRLDPDKHKNTVQMLTHAEHRKMRDLVRNALRQRPDHLVVGETRDETAFDLMQALNTGTRGSMSTVHASGPDRALVRLTNLVRMVDSPPTEEPARQMVAEGVHLLVWAVRVPGGKRIIRSIDEVVGVDANYQFEIRNIFKAQVTPAGDGNSHIEFIHNPDYVMGEEMAGFFRGAGFDPDRWTGSRARSEGKRAPDEFDRS